jgi:hypothetical protein
MSKIPMFFIIKKLQIFFFNIKIKQMLEALQFFL